MFGNITIADRITATRGRPTGFDYIRVALALLIVLWHTIVTCYGEAGQHAAYLSAYRPIITMILPPFFALSGFLVAGSLERTPELSKFLGLRALRILPALVVATFLAAFIVGPISTSLPIRQYFHDPLFRAYLLNAVGSIHFWLPGVFSANPLPGVVNGQLWTIPSELKCYLLLAVLAFLGVARRRRAVFWAALLMQLAVLISWVPYLEHGRLRVFPGPVPGGVLIMCFLAGVALFAWREKLPHSRLLFALAALASVAGLSVPLGDFLIPYPVAYATIYLGMTNPKAAALHRLGDLSYGIFLYGFPVQQLVASRGGWTHHWWINLAIALPITIGLAWLSWTLVEKPVLGLKKHLGLLRPVDMALERLKGTMRSGQRRIQIAYANQSPAGQSSRLEP